MKATTTVPAKGTATTPAPSELRARVEHVVAAGDTLSGIARRYGVDPDEIAALNDLRQRDLVLVGQRLRVPGMELPASLPARLLARPERLALLPRFVHWASRNGIPADLLMATAWLESGWNNQKVSSTGAIGIGQLMPDTARFVAADLIGVELDPRVPEHNIRMSARLLRFLLETTSGDVQHALYGYYQGLRSVARNGVYSDTKRYAADVLALRALFRLDGSASIESVVSTKGKANTTSASGATSRAANTVVPVATTRATTVPDRRSLVATGKAAPLVAPPTTRVPARAATGTVTRVRPPGAMAAAPEDERSS